MKAQADLFAVEPAAQAPESTMSRFAEPHGPFCYGCLRYAPVGLEPGEHCPRCEHPLSADGTRPAPTVTAS